MPWHGPRLLHTSCFPTARTPPSGEMMRRLRRARLVSRAILRCIRRLWPHTAVPHQPGANRIRARWASAPNPHDDLRSDGKAQVPQSSPRLIHHDGRLAELRDDLLSADVFVRNFAEVADVLATAGLRFAPMPGQDCRICAVIAPGQRTRVLAALAKAFAGQPVYADLLGHDVTLGTSLAEHLPQAVRALESPPTHQSLPELGNTAPPAPAVKVKGVRIYRPVVTGRRTLGYGPEHGCDLDFGTRPRLRSEPSPPSMSRRSAGGCRPWHRTAHCASASATTRCRQHSPNPCWKTSPSRWTR